MACAASVGHVAQLAFAWRPAGSSRPALRPCPTLRAREYVRAVPVDVRARRPAVWHHGCGRQVDSAQPACLRSGEARRRRSAGLVRLGAQCRHGCPPSAVTGVTVIVNPPRALAVRAIGGWSPCWRLLPAGDQLPPVPFRSRSCESLVHSADLRHGCDNCPVLESLLGCESPAAPSTVSARGNNPKLRPGATCRGGDLIAVAAGRGGYAVSATAASLV